MARKSLALLSLLLVAALCFYNADGCDFDLILVYVCHIQQSVPICYAEYRCHTPFLPLPKRSVPDDGIIECVPTKLSEFDCDEDDQVSYREFVVALTLDENNDTSRRAFEDAD